MKSLSAAAPVVWSAHPGEGGSGNTAIHAVLVVGPIPPPPLQNLLVCTRVWVCIYLARKKNKKQKEEGFFYHFVLCFYNECQDVIDGCFDH